MFNQKDKPYKPIRQQIDEEKAKKKKRDSVNFSSFLIDVKRNPMILIGLGGSALFTALMGLFIGLAPRIAENGDFILFGGADGIGHVIMGLFFGLLYAAAFPTLGEWGVYYWHKKASLRDPENRTQAVIGFGMMVLAGLFTLMTAISAAVILASLLHTFAAFQAIPDWAQKWTVLIIPISLGVHAGANIWYDHVSKYAEERRFMERGLQTVEIESENRIQQARVNAREQAAIAMADEYIRLSTGEAQKTGRQVAERTWRRDKENMGGDEDGDGTPNVVDPDYQPAATAKVRVAAPPLRGQHPEPVVQGFGDNGDRGPTLR